MVQYGCGARLRAAVFSLVFAYVNILTAFLREV